MVRCNTSSFVLGFVLLFLVFDLFRQTFHQTLSLRSGPSSPSVTTTKLSPDTVAASADEGDASEDGDDGDDAAAESEDAEPTTGKGPLNADEALPNEAPSTPIAFILPSPEPIKDFIISEDIDSFEDAGIKPGADGIVITAGENGAYGEQPSSLEAFGGEGEELQRVDKPEFFTALVPLGAGIMMQRQLRTKLKQALACWDNRGDFEPGERKGRWVLDRNAAGRQEKATIKYYGTSDAPSYDMTRVNSLPLKPYYWDASPKCEVPLRQWSRVGMCHVLRGKRVLVLGDELQGGFLDSLADLLGKQPVRHGFTADSRCPARLRPDGSCLSKEYSVCEGTVRIAYRRNDQLQFRGPGVGTKWSLNAESVSDLKAQPKYWGLGPDNRTDTVALPVNDLLYQPTEQRYDVIILSRGWTSPLTPSYKATSALNESLAILRSWPAHLASHYGIEPWEGVVGVRDKPPVLVRPQPDDESGGGGGRRRRKKRRRRSGRGRKLLQEAEEAAAPPGAQQPGGSSRSGNSNSNSDGGRGRRLAGGANSKPLRPKAYSQPLIIYREAIPPGLHRHCSVADPIRGYPTKQEPLTSPPRAMQPGVSGCGTSCEAREHNDRIARLLTRFYPSVLHMPVAVSTSMRPDAHIDPGRCELYGGLGPYDHWARVLYNVLRYAMSHNELWDE